jgi:hypothetical protein
MVIAIYLAWKVVFNDLTIGMAIPMTRSRTTMRFLSDPVVADRDRLRLRMLILALFIPRASMVRSLFRHGMG